MAVAAPTETIPPSAAPKTESAAPSPSAATLARPAVVIGAKPGPPIASAAATTPAALSPLNKPAEHAAEVKKSDAPPAGADFDKGAAIAALSAALTNAVSNVWYLREVWSKLGLSPYNRSYFRLLLPLAGNLCVLLLLRFALSAILPQWMALAIGFSLAYLVFVLVALAVGLDEDDRLIARALWSRLRGRMSAGVSA